MLLTGSCVTLTPAFLSDAGALGMLLYGSEPLEVATPDMTDYITLQDANVLLKLLAKGPVTVASDTGLPVSRVGVWAGLLDMTHTNCGTSFRSWPCDLVLGTEKLWLLQCTPLLTVRSHQKGSTYQIARFKR